MKLFFVLILSFLTFTAFAKRDVDFQSFSQKMNQNIDKTVQDNPQMYETKPIKNRKPASVKQIDDESTEKLDAIDDHADSHMSW